MAESVVCAKSVQSVMSDSVQPHGLQPARILYPWDSPTKNTGVGCHALFQGIFLTQGSNSLLSCLLYLQVSSLPLVSPGKPLLKYQSPLTWLTKPYMVWLWDSQFLGRLIRSPKVPKGIGVCNSQGGEKDKLFFPSTFLSLSHVKAFYL